MRVSKIVRPSAGWPKHQVRDRYIARGEDAARRLAKRLGIDPSRTERWIASDFPQAFYSARIAA